MSTVENFHNTNLDRNHTLDYPSEARRQARDAGLKRFFTGRPCIHGHIAERYTSTMGCVQCTADRYTAFRADNPKQRRVRKTADELREYRKAYRAAKKGQLDSWRKRKLAEDPEYFAKLRRAWAKRNEDKRRESYRNNYHKRRAKTRPMDGRITAAELMEMRRRYGKRCAYCGVKGKMTIDHIIPLSKGGEHVARNLQFLCLPCNVRKSNSAPEDFARSIGLLV